MDLTVVVRRENSRPAGSDAGFCAEIRELPGCVASAATLDELVDVVAEAVGLYLWDLPATLHGWLGGVGEHAVTVRPASAPPLH